MTHQVGLGLYVANMFKAMNSASMQQEADFQKAGHPGLAPSGPKMSCKEWDILQGLDVRTLLGTYVVNGRDNNWDEAVAELCANCTTSSDLLQNLKTVRRTICRTSHARVVLFPTQDLIREAGKDVTDEELIVFCEDRAHEYEEYDIKGSPDDWTLQEALLLYGSFYILESLDVKWSDYHLFKCNCAHCFQWASCHHVVLASMVCDPNLKCPTKYLTSEIQARRKRGRPGPRKGDRSDGESEEECRSRIEGPSTAMAEVNVFVVFQNVHMY